MFNVILGCIGAALLAVAFCIAVLISVLDDLIEGGA